MRSIRDQAGIRIVAPGSAPIDVQDEFAAVVVVGFVAGAFRAYPCTGTLIGRNVVLTAGHCAMGETQDLVPEVFIGVSTTGPGARIRVARTVQFSWPVGLPSEGLPSYDLAVLVLEREVTEAVPIPLAPLHLLDTRPADALAVGYGSTDVNGAGGEGYRRFTTIPIANYGDAQDPETMALGAIPGLEFIARGVDVSTCRGDSGGVLVQVAGRWAVIGVTSRRAAGVSSDAFRLCAKGGIYGRVDLPECLDWIQSIPGVHLD